MADNIIVSKLDANQVIRQAYDDDKKALRVDAEITATIGELDVTIDAAMGDNIAIADPTGTNYLLPNADGSINSTFVDADGNQITSQASGSQQALDVGINVAGVQIDPRQTRQLTSSDVVTAEQGGTWEVSLDPATIAQIGDVTVQNGPGAAAVNIQDGGNSITVDAADLDIRNLSFAIDKVDVSGSEITLDPATISALGNVEVTNGAGSAAVNIQDGGNSITVDAVNLDIRDLSASTDTVAAINYGTRDGNPASTKYYQVNNIRQQILATDDRNQDIIYADFGTKDQRVIQIIYSSATFPGVALLKTISYTLVGNKYRRDSIDWSVV